jgi:hypothetical protein
MNELSNTDVVPKTLPTISLKIVKKCQDVSRKITLPEDVNNLLDQYVAAARESDSNLTDTDVIRSIFLNHFNRDRAFMKWRKNKTK